MKEEVKFETGIDFEFILENRIKYGRYQIKNSLSTYNACSLEGVEVVLLTIVLPILIKEWDLSNLQKIVLS